MSTFCFTLYTVELRSEHENLLAIADKFAENAEIAEYSRESGTVTLQFISTAEPAQIERICDDFKKEVESSDGTRLVYKVKSTVL